MIGLQLGILGLAFTLQAAVLFGLLAWFAGPIGAGLTDGPVQECGSIGSPA